MKHTGWVYNVLPLFLKAETFVQWPFCMTLISVKQFSHPSSKHYQMTLLQPIFSRKQGSTLAVEAEHHFMGRSTTCLMSSEHGTEILLQELPRCSCTAWMCNLQLFIKPHDLWNMDGYALMPQRSLDMLYGSLTWRMWMTLMVSQEKLPSTLWYIVQRLQRTELVRRRKSSSWPPGITMYHKPTFKENYYTGVKADQIRLQCLLIIVSFQTATYAISEQFVLWFEADWEQNKMAQL